MTDSKLEKLPQNGTFKAGADERFPLYCGLTLLCLLHLYRETNLTCLEKKMFLQLQKQFGGFSPLGKKVPW